MGSITWGREIAEVYDKTYAAESGPSVLGPIVGLLAELARSEPALEFAAGTGRVALALSARGSPCTASSCPPTWPGSYAPSLVRGRFR
jgi:hypothetical protein